MKEFEEAARGLRDLFFPRRCCVCDAGLELDEEDFCRNCFSDLPLTYFWDWEDNPAYRKLADKAPVKAAASLFYFRPDAGYNSLMHQIKYHGHRTLGFRLGYLFGKYLAESPFPRPDAVVPVPLHPLRRFRRGYNQSEAIAAGIASAFGIPVYNNLLHRTRMTRSQAKLSETAKRENVKGAFRHNPAEAKKMTDAGIGHILLVDDTLTTGATLGECASLLTENFNVSIGTLAYAG